jgi:hypothetical protein
MTAALSVASRGVAALAEMQTYPEKLPALLLSSIDAHDTRKLLEFHRIQ